MNMENNPIIQERLAALRGENQESLRQSLGEAMGQFVGGGGTMGISGMMAAGRGKMSDDFGENLGQQQAGFLADYDAQMRAQQAAANQAWSGRESAYDSSGFQNDATKAAANIAAAAQRYSADQQLRGVRAGISSQDAQARFAQQMAVFGLGSQMAGMQQQGEGLGALGLAHDYGQSMLPYQQAFGSSQSTSQGPQVSPFNAAVSGGLAGAGFGNQLGTQFGFQPFGQGGGKG